MYFTSIERNTYTNTCTWGIGSQCQKLWFSVHKNPFTIYKNPCIKSKFTV